MNLPTNFLKLNIKKKLPLVFAISMLTATAAANKTQDAYQTGHLAMAQQKWSQAQESFATAASDKSLADSATYWQAYVLYQNNRHGEAKLLVKKLLKEYPKSQWADDAQMLLLENGDAEIPVPPMPRMINNTHIVSPPASPSKVKAVPRTSPRPSAHPRPNAVPRPARPPQAPTLDAEMRLFAIQQIMFSNPEKGLKLIKEMLENDEAGASKVHALQLLGMSQDEQAAELLYDLVMDEENEGLKGHAIQMLSMRQDAKSKERLLGLYKNENNRDTKAAIIQGFIHSDDSRTLERLLAKEKDQDLKLQMIHVLGIMGDSNVLTKMYRTQDAVEVKAALLQAMAMSGEAAEVKRVIAQEKLPEIRQQAIHALMMLGDVDGDYLLDLYSKAKSADEKHMISNVMMTSDLPPEMAKKLYQQEQDSDVKRSLLMLMMTSQSSEELAGLFKEEKDPEIKREILQHIGMMQGVDELMSLYKEDPTVAESEGFFMAFGMTDSSEHNDFLLDQFAAGNHHTQQQILEVFMMQGNADPLVALYKEATTKPMKKRILEMLVMTDADRVIEVIEAP
ncbi:HEAT repeat domain-containing protein [Marinicella rhabdoformis]|uniref:HEAT repeat domain-containing protein n=1 Tax=Marinicella rhabdoformis TaxID=2580566 RepID=UPI0012AECA71|nr:HEAT repeat domain-containing protein [Marinicella rhabdoformis]